MKGFKLGLTALLLSACLGGKALAQGTVEDYRRAFALQEKFSASNVYYSNVQPHWIDGTHRFWYVRHTPEGRVYVVVDAQTKKRTELFDHPALAQALTKASQKKVDANTVLLERLSVDKETGALNFVFNNHRWHYNVNDNKLEDKGELPVIGRIRLIK